MVRKYYVIILSVNYVSVFCMKLRVNGESHIKYTYIIGRKYSHVMLPDHASLSLKPEKKVKFL